MQLRQANIERADKKRKSQSLRKSMLEEEYQVQNFL
jgi:hypothetical protein